MDTIKSFEVNHLTLRPGIYLSRTDGAVDTYDLRVTVPNRTFLPNATMHTIEHLFAVRARNGKYGAKIVYFGPMGCRTGFYLLTQGMDAAQVIELIRDTFSFISSYDGPIPGATEKECGNWKEHDLADAKRVAAEYSDVIRDWTEDRLTYLA